MFLLNYFVNYYVCCVKMVVYFGVLCVMYECCVNILGVIFVFWGNDFSGEC